MYKRTNMMKFGYARCSTKNQSVDYQIDALKKEGCDEIFSEKISGRAKDKPELNNLLLKLRKGDVVIVHSLDRLGRTSKELILLLNEFKEKGIQFKSLKEGVFDTTTALGEAIFQIMAILKAMEVEVLRERVNAGLESARARGRKGGRKKGTYNKNRAKSSVALYQKGTPINEILKITGIKSKSTLYEYLRKEGAFS